MADRGRPLIALDIAPLGERFHTGIANVAKALARELLGDATVEPHFFVGRQAVQRKLVERVVQMDGAEILWWITGRCAAPLELSDALDRPAIGIHTAVKIHRRLFPTEVQFVHDLTTIVTPQFHTQEAIDWWQARLLPDLLSSDLIVANSQATKADIETYFPQARHVPCIVAPLAPCVSAVPPLPGERKAEPYVVVLGTLEPRKNVEAVFQCLAENQELLAAAAFVFVGRWGWGPSAQEMVARFGLQDAVAGGRIRFAGFVTDEVRDQLVATARCVIYPSRYEGFGLPVVEALSFGTAVITSYGTSLPEAGGSEAIYCDTGSADMLAAAIGTALEDRPDAPRERARRQTFAATFDWTRTYERIRDAALEIAR